MDLLRKALILLCCIFACAALPGCGEENNPYRVDTVVRIPIDPTEAPTEAEQTESGETEEATEEAEPDRSASGSKSSGSKSTSGSKTTSGSKSSSSASTKSTEPAATEPPATEAPATEPPATELPVTEPPETIPATEAPYDPSGYSVGSLEYAILDQLNAYREEAGLPALSMSRKLCGIAAVRAEEISRVWSHSRPDGRNYASVMSDYGYGYSKAAENLVYVSGSGDAAAIVSKWMSADNKESILSESFTTAGIGVYRSGGVTYVANLLVG